MPIISSASGASSQAWGQFKQSAAPVYVEDVFSTYLYTGTGASQTITNGIDLSTKGGMVWLKSRNAIQQHRIYDTTRTGSLSSNLSSGQSNGWVPTYFNFNTNGFFVNASGGAGVNTSSTTYASWSFRKQPKFFDVVQYTGTGSNLYVNHSLGSVPGMIIIKRIVATGYNWYVYHRSLGNNKFLTLDTSSSETTDTTAWASTTPTATQFRVGTNANVNDSGVTYIAYLFAHDAGGFGLDGSSNIISCGTFTGSTTVNLGYEPQYILVKSSDASQDWYVVDTMRGWTVSGYQYVSTNLDNAETGSGANIYPTSTGFITNGLSYSYIYMAIRRGPMKVPTDATKVFDVKIVNSVAANTSISTTNLADCVFYGVRSGGAISAGIVFDRLRGIQTTNSPWLGTAITNSEFGQTSNCLSAQQNTGIIDNWTNYNLGAINIVYPVMSRAPSFMDVVCYTGTGVAPITINHNLGVKPELIIVKSRSVASLLGWIVGVGGTNNFNSNLRLNDTAGFGGATIFGNVTSSSFQITYTPIADTNQAGATYVAYLFATCPGVSKVGTYSGTGATQTINCGFTGGARYVLIKRTDSTGDWWVWDTARGMISGTDPRLAYNSTAAETNANWVYTTTGGFQIVTSDASVNASGGTYIFLAIA